VSELRCITPHPTRDDLASGVADRDSTGNPQPNPAQVSGVWLGNRREKGGSQSEL
jgi:hypothetical protein